MRPLHMQGIAGSGTLVPRKGGWGWRWGQLLGLKQIWAGKAQILLKIRRLVRAGSQTLFVISEEPGKFGGKAGLCIAKAAKGSIYG